MGGTCLVQFRARIGQFYGNAIKSSTFRLSFIDLNNIYPFLILVYSGTNGLPLALWLSILHSPENTHKNGINPPNCTSSCSYCMPYVPDSNYLTLLLCTLLYLFICLTLISNDIHPNPGPPFGPDKMPGLSLVHVNICSLQNKALFVEAELSSFDIITVSETWLYEGFPIERIRIPGYYDPVRKDREDGVGGGVAIYVKEHLICKPRPDLDIPNLEAIWIETKNYQETILVGSFYRTPGANVAYWDLIDRSIKLAMNTPHKVYILGDFNEDVTSTIPTHLQRILTLNSLVQVINETTRYDGESRKVIDLILLTNPDVIEKVGVLPQVRSDHCCPYVCIVNNKPKANRIKRTLYNYSQLDIEKYVNGLSAIDWSNITTLGNVNSAADFFTDSLLSVAIQCMPSKTVTESDKDKSWMTDDIRKCIRKKEYIHTLAKKFDIHWCWAWFRRYRNDLTAMIRKRKDDYLLDIENKINANDNYGTKCWWKLVNQFVVKKGLPSSEIPPIEHDNRVHYSPEEKAECFNKYFTDNSKINGDDDELPILQEKDVYITDLIITEEMVVKVIKDLSPNKAVGPDLIHNKMLIKAVNVISEPLAKLLNRSLLEHTFPASWKTAHVSPIYKLKGERFLCGNYRPISLLSCVAKVMEKCVQQHMFEYLKTNSLLTPSQSGFIPGDSTTFQLLAIYEDFCKALDSKITSQAVFFDISKAFDKVWHRGLLYKLHCIGIRGTLLNWLTDYLKDRRQAVVIKGKTSTFRPIQAGVPQGSVLGPLLFLVYINDIVEHVNSSVKLFADDTSMYLSLEDNLDRSRILNSDLRNIVNWSHSWKVDFNPSKTKLLTLTRKRQPDSLPLLFNGQTLVENQSHKHLGVVLQNDGKWDNHIESIIAKTRISLACLRSYKYRFSRKTLHTIYTSFILPHIEYADVVWDNCTDRLADELESLHLDAIRTITGAVRGTSHIKLYHESGIVPLKERRRRHKLMTYFKITNGLAPAYVNEYLPPLVSSINPYHRRNPLERSVPHFSTTLYQQSFFISTTYLWNELPENCKLLDSLSSFKRFLRLNDPIVPRFYFGNNRFSEIIHTKIRLEISDLQADLVKRHLAEDSICQCGYRCENAHHYLFDCPNFNDARDATLNQIDRTNYRLDILLYGNRTNTLSENQDLFEIVSNYIVMSKRFV